MDGHDEFNVLAIEVVMRLAHDPTTDKEHPGLHTDGVTEALYVEKK